MLKSVTAASITAIAAAALAAGLGALLTSTVPEAKAGSPILGAVQQFQAEDDRLPLHVTGSACSSRSWPNYDAACQFDRRTPSNEARTAPRVIDLRQSPRS